MSIKVGNSRVSWESSTDQGEPAASIELKSVGDAFQLGGFGGAFSYAIHCLVARDLTQAVSASAEKAANFIAGHLNSATSKQLLEQLCEKPDGQNAPVIAHVIKAGNVDARQNVLRFLQNEEHKNLLNQSLSVAHDGTSQDMTFATVIGDALAENAMEQFISTNNLADDPEACSQIRHFRQNLDEFRAFLDGSHTCHEIEKEIQTLFGKIFAQENFLQFARDVSLSADTRKSLTEVLYGPAEKPLPGLLPLGSRVRTNIIEPLCGEFEIQYDDTKYDFTRSSGPPTAADGDRLCKEINRLIDLGTPEGIYAATNLLFEHQNVALNCAQKFCGSCGGLDKILDKILPLFEEQVKPHMHPQNGEQWSKHLKKMGAQVKELSLRKPIPPLPSRIRPAPSNANFQSYMQEWIGHVEGLMQWGQPQKACELFSALQLTEDMLSHLSDEDVERLEALPDMKAPDGTSLAAMAYRTITYPQQIATSVFSGNVSRIAKRLVWTAGRINDALAGITAQDAHEKLFKKGSDGTTLLNAMLKHGSTENKERLLQILQEMKSNEFVEILNHGPDGAALTDFLINNDTGSKILCQKLTTADHGEFLEVLDNHKNGKKIFTLLRKTEEGCALLEFHFADPAAFIKLMDKSWFGADELSFFRSVRGNFDVENTGDDGESIDESEWASGVADSQFFAKMAAQPGVFHAAMQHQKLCFPFMSAMALASQTNLANILTAETFIEFMQTSEGGQIFENIRAAAKSKEMVRNLFVELLKNEKVVSELLRKPGVGDKLVSAVREFHVPNASTELIRKICTDALLSSRWTDEAAWGEVLKTPENRAVLWSVCNELAEGRGPQARVLFSRLTQSATFRRVAIGHEAGRGYAETNGTPGVFAEMGEALTPQAKRALLLGKMTSETTYGESHTQYRDVVSGIPELMPQEYPSLHMATLAQEMLRRHSEELFILLEGMEATEVADVLSRRADNGCTLLEFAVLNRRDSTVMKLADYYRKRGIPFSRVGLREMLAFKEKTFMDAVEALERAGHAATSICATMGGAVSASPTAKEWHEIQQKFSRNTHPGNYLELQNAALEKLARQKLDALEIDQGQLLEIMATYEKVIADGERHGTDVKPLRAVLDDLRAKSDVGISGRIKLAVAAASTDVSAKAAFDGYMDRLIGESPGVVEPAATLDARILNATTVKLIERDEAGWLAVVNGDEIRIENIGELAQCQKLETITFNSLMGSSPFTADELFSLRNVKSLKRLDVGRFSNIMTPNLVEILFRERPDLTITAILHDERTLVWEPKSRPGTKAYYSHSRVLRPGVELSSIKRIPPPQMTPEEMADINRRKEDAALRDRAAYEAKLAREEASHVPEDMADIERRMEAARLENVAVYGALEREILRDRPGQGA
jgi:hypothetical protein